MSPPKSPRLVLRRGEDQVVFPVLLRETLIGRIDSNHVVLDEAGVSRIHARLLRDPAGLVDVEDCGSTQGTLVNGDPVDRLRLKDGDVLTLGSVKLLFIE